VPHIHFEYQSTPSGKRPGNSLEGKLLKIALIVILAAHLVGFVFYTILK